MANNIKDLKLRIKSVKSTQKITRAMKMVAAAKLRRSREKLEIALPYITKMQETILDLSQASNFENNAPKLLVGTSEEKIYLVIVVTSDRGLCGAFNSSIIRATKKYIQELRDQGKDYKIFCIGKKGYESLKIDYSKNIIGHTLTSSKKEVNYSDSERIANKILAAFSASEFDVCVVLYNKFKNAISQIATMQQLIPLAEHDSGNDYSTNSHKLFEYEPSEEAILNTLLPKNVKVQLYRALLENAASEQGARMTAMDNATTNAGEMIKNLTLLYNRTRQAAITKELIEIISGAEAL
ncbi:ATP synthase gamma subunit [Rickettsiales bacterium Ac37b]|nr:ATP synthase gamma subunit [Rickettsiales bacterium Ac37b]